MDGKVGFVFVGILHFALHCGCSDVILSADRQFVMEYSALTFTCSTLNDCRYVDFFKNQTLAGRIGYIENNCSLTIHDPVSSCSCLNHTTYACTTNPLNRFNYSDIWSCVSTSHASAGTKSKNNITIDVRVPIASVFISPQQNNSMTINEGEVLQLTCETSYGLPAANISWYLENNTDSVYVNDRILNASKREVNENADRTKSVKSTLTHTVNRGEDGMDVYCNASNEEYIRVSSKAIRLNIQYLPQDLVYINGNLSYDTFYMMKNSSTTQSLQCSVQGGNPLAKISWSCYNGIQTDRNTPSSAVSDISWFARDFNESTCTCHASHVLSWSGSQEVSVKVIFEPSLIICKVGNSELFQGILNVTLSSNVELNCSSNGNPKPYNFTWVWPTRNTSSGQLLSVKHVQRSFQGKYTLLVENIMTPSIGPTVKGHANTTFDMHVQYSPSTPTLKLVTNKTNITTNNISVKRNETVRIACIADGNPTPFYNWSTGHEAQILTTTFDSDTHLTCKVSNTMFPTGGMRTQASVDASLHVNVLLKPARIICDVGTAKLERGYFNVSLNSNVTLTCKSDGNPKPNNFTWIWPKRNTSAGHILSLSNVQRSLHGRYTLFVENVMNPTIGPTFKGQANTTFDMHIQYKASIITFMAMNTTNTTVHHGDEVTFACEVDSDPPADIRILSRNGSILKISNGNNLLIYSKKSSCLEDIGQFTCISANKRNRRQPDRKNVTVNVKCSPFYRPNYFQNTTIATGPGNFAVLHFSVFSNPPPTQFTWTNISNNMRLPIDTTTSDRVIINTTDDMSSSLIITRVEPWDTGNYSVEVENEIGSMNETFRIVVEIPSTSPDPPIINVPPDEQANTNTIGTVIGGSVGAITAVVITAVVVIIIVYRKMKGTANHDNNNLQLLHDARHASGNTETCFDKVLTIYDDAPMYEEEMNIYGNIGTNDAFGNTLTIKLLRDTIRQLKLDPLPLFKEFYTLQIGLKYDTKHALKNRYRSVYPYDASRVVLPFLRGDLDSDFINASYIDGFCKPRKYIAAQGPLENTINDTWRMIHSEDVKVIVMVTNLIETGKIKCFKYLPDDRATYGECNVKLDHVEEYADFVVRQITYSMEGTRFERQLVQFHYSSWPDKNVPPTALSLVQFWRKVRQSEFVENTPWIVHCSTGVGRTGTFIALDYLFDQGKIDGKLNVPETVNLLREQRISMVQTKDQYLYLYDAITELLDPVGQIFTPENSLKIRSTATEERKLIKEFRVITNSIVNVKTDIEGNDYDLKKMPDGLLPENICKSIDQTVIPDDLFRPLISTGNDFINAVYIPTYRDAEKYIVTQYPLQNTVLDFVRLLWDHSIEDVVLLDVGDEKLHCYWPQNKSPLRIGPFVISLLSVDEGNYCTIRRIDISLAERRQNKQTVVHQFTAWPGYLNLCEPKPLANFLQTISRIGGPVVVQCHDGYSRSGLFAALLSIVDRIKTDKEVAIADTVRVVKHRRHAAVNDVEQYQFCHEVVFEYLKNRGGNVEDSENQEYVNMTFPKFL